MGRLIQAAAPASVTSMAPRKTRFYLHDEFGGRVTPMQWVEGYDSSNVIRIEIDPADAILQWHAQCGLEHIEKSSRHERTVEVSDMDVGVLFWDKQVIEDWVAENVADIAVAQRVGERWRFIFQTEPEKKAFSAWMKEKSHDSAPAEVEVTSSERLDAIEEWCREHLDPKVYRHCWRSSTRCPQKIGVRFRYPKDKLFFILRWSGAAED